MISLIFGALFGAIFSFLFASFGNDILLSKPIITWRVTNALKTLDTDGIVKTNNSIIVNNEDVLKIIIKAMLSGEGGVSVLGAPIASGKTTYIDEAVKRIKTDNPKAVIKNFRMGNILLTKDGIHEKLHVPHLSSLSEYIPKETIIILDQIDLAAVDLNRDMLLYIVSLATDSRNSKVYNVIICVSNPEVYESILELNGRDKIKPMFTSTFTFKWNSSQMDNFIKLCLPYWSPENRNKLIALCGPAHSPGVLWTAINMIKNREYSEFNLITKDELKTILIDVNAKVKLWKKFQFLQ
jgi:hypothetical protein